jgi:hypothetical protein
MHLEHFRQVNDMRIAAELTGGLAYFFAFWELPAAGWRYSLIPDAVFAIRNQTFAAEIDRGGENLRYFVRTKIGPYMRGLEGFPLTAVLIVIDRKARMDALARAIKSTNGNTLFTMIDLVRQHDFRAPIFFSGPHAQGVSLV